MTRPAQMHTIHNHRSSYSATFLFLAALIISLLVPGFLVTTGWGTWGFKAIPAAGEAMAELIATGRTPSLIKPFGLDRFARDHVLADQGSTGTR